MNHEVAFATLNKQERVGIEFLQSLIGCRFTDFTVFKKGL